MLPPGFPLSYQGIAVFHATERLPHLLPPSAYGSDDSYSWEVSNVFAKSWHFVGLQTDLSRPGDFLTVEICGQPIQVRNIGGNIHAVSNVCAHRHCLLTSERKGSSPKLRCQYHGWEYDASGATQRIPLAQNFAPLDRASLRIPVYRVETLGPLVFVNLDAIAPDLRTAAGDQLEPLLHGFGEGWEVVLSREFPHHVNWKIPVENTLEAYHVPAVHPETFREDPGEARSEHFLGETGSSFQTTLPFAPHSRIDAWFQRIEGRALHLLTDRAPTSAYRQHHLFPNILFSLTDMVSLLHVVRPTGSQTCTSVIYQFGRVGKSFVSRQCSRLWGRLVAGITLKILQEDFRLYTAIQRGLNSSHNPGMLGRCEERIYEFQRWLQNQSQQTTAEASCSTISDVRTAVACDCSPINPPCHLATSSIDL